MNSTKLEIPALSSFLEPKLRASFVSEDLRVTYLPRVKLAHVLLVGNFLGVERKKKTETKHFIRPLLYFFSAPLGA